MPNPIVELLGIEHRLVGVDYRGLICTNLLWDLEFGTGEGEWPHNVGRGEKEVTQKEASTQSVSGTLVEHIC